MRVGRELWEVNAWKSVSVDSFRMTKCKFSKVRLTPVMKQV